MARRAARRLTRGAAVAALAALAWGGDARAQGPEQGLLAELEALARVDLLPRYRPNSRVAQVSSYDTTGGNNDGFSGRYSYLRKEPAGLVLLDVRGPGVLHRIWTPTPTDDTLLFYFDGERAPRLRVRFRDLFSGAVFPFVRPLVGNEVGGFYAYVPLVFARSLKVVFAGERIMFHQLQYRRYADARGVRSFAPRWGAAEREALDRVSARWGWTPSREPPTATGATCDTQAVALAPGDSADLFRSARGGRITYLAVTPASAFAGPDRDVLLDARWDADARPAIRAPVADFFGFAYGRPAMRGLLAGTRDDTSYAALPMPFDSSASLRLVRLARAIEPRAPVRATVRVCHTTVRRDPRTEGRLYAAWRREPDAPTGRPYLLLGAEGRGHHVGTVLLAQGRTPGMTLFFEGDDVTHVDGERRLHGTGSEDYFNGGWYALLDRWDQGFSLPLHGALAYSLPMARTGGYRFYLADKVSFERRYRLTIEHGPEGNAVPVDYTSVAFYYGDTPPAEVTAPAAGNTALTVPRTHVFHPQLVPLSVGWHTEVRFLENNRDLLVRPTGGEPGLVRLELGELPNGHYRLLLGYSEASDGGEFSVWQRQRQVVPWRAAAAASERLVVRAPLGEVELTDEVRTLSIQTRGPAGRNAFRFHEVVLERVP